MVGGVGQERGLRGYVHNRGDGVRIVVAGPPDRLAALVEGLDRPPPRARIVTIRRSRALDEGWQGFTIEASQPGTVQAGIVADLAVCPACIAEIADKKDPRYQYALTNINECGPRFSIVTGLSYDPARPTMDALPLCPAS